MILEDEPYAYLMLVLSASNSLEKKSS